MTVTPACWPVNVTDDVTLDGTGDGSVLLGPVPPMRTWAPGVLSCTGHGAGLVEAFVGPAEGAPVAVATTDPGVIQMADAMVDLHGGQFVTVRFTGGTPGALALASLRAQGTKA